MHAYAAGHALMAAALIEGLDPARAAKFRAWQTGPKPPAFLDLIRKRGRILSDAWLAYIGHTRPGMGKGLPPAEAKAKAA